MATWETLFLGYNPYADVLAAYPDMYTQASNADVLFYLWYQILLSLVYDVRFVFQVTFVNLIPLVVVCALIWVFFVPLFRKMQSW